MKKFILYPSPLPSPACGGGGFPRALLLALLAVVISGCAGRSAMPTASYKYGDEKLSCADLRMEIAKSEREVKKLWSEHNSAHSGNVALGVVGGLLFWPALFALDTSDAEKVEINAHKERIEGLERIMQTKNCGAYKSTLDDLNALEQKPKNPAPAADRRISE